MGELVFVGLGLHDEKGITLRGLDEARSADVVFAELYTSSLTGATIESVERLIGKKIRTLTRADVEDGGTILKAAARQGSRSSWSVTRWPRQPMWICGCGRRPRRFRAESFTESRSSPRPPAPSASRRTSSD